MKIVFMGTPEFAVPALEALKRANFSLRGIYSQPPRPTGRGHKVQKSPTHMWGDANGVEVLTPNSLKGEEAATTLKSFDPDVVVVAAYGLLLPKSILEIPKHGCINIHGSLLPRWRGAAPIHRALIEGDTETGITIMGMEEGLDTGPEYLKESIPITPQSTYLNLHQQLSELGGELLVKVLTDLDSYPPIPQALEGVTYAHKIKKEERIIDWNESADLIERKVRALNPWPGVCFTHKGESIKIIKARVLEGTGAPGEVISDDLIIGAGENSLQPLLLQRPGGKPVSLMEFLRGYSIPKGTKLSG